MSILSVFAFGMFISLSYVISGMFVYSARKTKRREFYILALGFFASAFAGWQYFGTTFYEGIGSEGDTLAIFKISSFISVTAGWNLLLFGFQRLTESVIPRRFYYYLVHNLFIVPYVFLSFTHINWMGDHWEITYETPLHSLMVTVGIGFLLVEICYSTLLIIKDTGIKSVKTYYLSMIVLLLLSFPVFILRDSLGLAVNIWLIPIIFALFMFAIAIFTHPEVFLTSSITPQFLLIMDKENGAPIKVYHFIENRFQSSNQFLFASAISAIETLFQELNEAKTPIRYVGYESLHIQIEHHHTFLLVLATEKASPAINSMLTHLAFQLPHVSGFHVTKEEKEEIDVHVTNAFIHQIKRLKLLINPVTI
ncbi:MAG: hypothetical protein ACW99Q_13955 [Candidatus Kariarchaeaceae archaeon]|jgi:hypothetical protein